MIINLIIDVLQHIFIIAFKHNTVVHIFARYNFRSVEFRQNISLDSLQNMFIVALQTNTLVIILVKLFDGDFKPLLEEVFDPLHFQGYRVHTICR